MSFLKNKINKVFLIILFMVILLPIVNAALTDNIKYYYKFDAGTGSLVLDSTGRLNGTASNNGVWSSYAKLGPYGQAAFNSAYYTSIGGNTEFTEIHSGKNWSINIWENRSSSLIGANIVLCSTVGGDRNGIQISGDNTYQYMHVGTSTGPYTGPIFQVYNTTGVPSGWVMLTYTYDSSLTPPFRAYYNGVLVHSQYPGPGVFDTGPSDGPMVLGNYVYPGGYNYKGAWDEFGYWTRGLSQAEVTTLYNSGVGLQYPFANEVLVQVSPVNNSFLDRQLNVTLKVIATDNTSNVNFYWSNNTLIGIGTVSSGYVIYNLVNLTPNKEYCWLANTTTKSTGTWCFIPDDEPKIQNLRISDIDATNFIIEWNNEIDMQWFAARIGSDVSELRFITGSSNLWNVSNIIKNKPYTFTFQQGDNATAISDYYNFNFRSLGWNNNMLYNNHRRIMTINSTIVGADYNNYAVNITLTENNFYYCGMYACYPSFTNLNYSSNGSDIRFYDYYDYNPLRYNITYWNVPGDGGINYSTIPQQFASTGTWSDYSNLHDGDWNTDGIPNTYGEDYFNYTIPSGAKTNSLFRIYAGEWGYDFELPLSCYGGTKLRFKTTADYPTSTINTYCQNNTDSTWIPIWSTTNSRLVYETMMTWNYVCEVRITVIPRHFNDNTQTYVEGVDGNYDEKIIMYYGDPTLPKNVTNLNNTGIIQNAVTMSDEIDFVMFPPVISSLTTSSNTGTGINISWNIDQIVDSRIRYATNPYLLETTWASRIINTTENIDFVQGLGAKTFLLDVIPTDYISLVSVTASNSSYSNNYTINSTVSPVTFTIPNLNTTEFINWTIIYTENKTRIRNSNIAEFKLENLIPNTVYYYEANAYGISANTTSIGTFTLGTPPSTPSASFYNYTETRNLGIATVCFNITNLNGNAEINYTLQYWTNTSTYFDNVLYLNPINSVGIVCSNITAVFGSNYYYRAKVQGATTGYSESYNNLYMLPQEFFAGSVITDDDDNLDRQYCPTNSEGYVNDSVYCYEQTGYREGSYRLENSIWIETNISNSTPYSVKWWNGTNWGTYLMNIANISNTSTTYGSNVNASLINNLVAYYKFDGNANDVLGLKNGTVTGALNSNNYGKINQGYSFNSSTDKITVPSSSSLGLVNDFSFGFWIYSNLTTPNAYIISKTSTGYVANPYILYLGTNSKFNLYVGDGASQVSVEVDNAIVKNSWYYVTVTKSGNTVKFYYNGTQTGASKTLSAITPTNSAEALYITNAANNGAGFYGYIDELGIWNRSLTSTEVAYLFNSGSGFTYPFTVPVNLNDNIMSYYKFDSDNNDSLGRYNATFSNATIISGKVSNAVNFTRTSRQQINITNNAYTGLSTNSTISFWIWRATSTSEQHIFSTRYINNTDSPILTAFINDAFYNYFVDGYGRSCSIGGYNFPVPINSWHMITITRNVTNATLYLDGALNLSQACENTTIFTINPTNMLTAIGFRPLNTNTYFNGKVDELGIWNRSMNDSEILYLYNNGAPTSSQQYPYISTISQSNYNFSYLSINNLSNSWQTFYITNSLGNVLLNWTKPGLFHPINKTRVDEPKYVSFDNTPDTVNYTQYYFRPYPYKNTTSFNYCQNAPGGNLYDCMSLTYWGQTPYTKIMGGTKYDRGETFTGGVWDGDIYDTGYMSSTLPLNRSNSFIQTQFSWTNSTETRFCFAFVDTFITELVHPTNNITNYYFRYWQEDGHFSSYLGVSQNTNWNYIGLFKWQYDEISYTRDWVTQEDTKINSSEIWRTHNINTSLYNTFAHQSNYNETLIAGFKEGFEFDLGGYEVYETGIQTDGQWNNYLTGKNQRAFVIFNLPDNATLQGMDSDSDSLTDYDELFVYYTDPYYNDTSEVGFNDGWLVANGYDPALVYSHPGPEVTLELPLNNSVREDGIFNFSVNSTTPSGVGVVTLKVINSGMFEAYSNTLYYSNFPTNQNSVFLNVTLTFGNYTWYIISEDQYGVNTLSGVFNLEVNDLTNPSIGYTSNSTFNNSYIGTNNNIYIEVQVNDTNLQRTDINLYNSSNMIYNSTSFITLANGTVYTNFTNVPIGIYYWNVTAYDLGGNYNSTPTYTGNVIGPFNSNNYTVSFPYVNNGFTNNNNLNYGFNTTDPYYNHTIYSLTNYSNNVNTNITSTDKNILQILTDGKYYYALTIYDKAGNYQYYDPNITIDTINPNIVYNSNTTPTNSFIGPNKNIFVDVTSGDINFNSTTIYLYNTTQLIGTKQLNMTEYCYQESANTSNQAGTDGNCGQIYTGSYTHSFTGGDEYKEWDGNWNTFNPTPWSYTTFTYKIPSGVIVSESLWQIKDFNATNNLSLAKCWWDGNSITLSLWVDSVLGQPGFWFCSNSTGGYEYLKYFTVPLFPNIYEEAIYWKVNYSNVSLNYNFTNLSNGVYYYNATVSDLAGNINKTETRTATVISSFQSQYYNVTFPYVNNGYTNNNILSYGFNTSDVYYNYTNFSLTNLSNNVTKSEIHYNTGYCIQELANDSNCGIASSAAYSSSTWINPLLAFDKNWNTYASPTLSSAIAIININIPNNDTYVDGNTLIQIKFGNGTHTQTNNLTLNYIGTAASCISYINSQKKIILNILYRVTDSQISISCDYAPGSSAFNSVASNLTGKTNLFYEMNIIWSSTPTNISYTLSDGKYYYDLRIFDKAGNSQYYDPNITIDTIKPTISYNNTFTTANNTVLNKFGIKVGIITNDTNLNSTTVYIYNSSQLITSYTNTSPVFNVTYLGVANTYYYFNATSCDYANNCNSTETRTILPDLGYPTITINPGTNINTLNNQQIISRDRYNLTMNITYADDNLFAAEINITCNVSGQIFYWEALNIVDLNYTTYNTTNILNRTLQKCQFYTAASDSHTAQIIPKYKSKKVDSGISFLTENNNNVQIVAEESKSNVQSVKTEKLIDRETFSFDFSDNKNTRTFTLLADNPIYYIEQSNYPAHFVIWNNNEKKGNWVDFASKIDEIDDYKVKKINDYEYKITIKTKNNKNKLSFNSIGGTLITNVTSTFYIGSTIYTTGSNIYDNSTFSNYTYYLTQTSINDDFTNTSITGISNSTSIILENMSSGLYTYQFTHSNYFNQTYYINTTNNSVYQNYSTYQSEMNIQFLAYAKMIYLDNVSYILQNLATGYSISGNTGVNNTLLTLYTNASNYTLYYSIPGYLNGSVNISTTYQQNYSLTVGVSYLATFSLFDEKTTGVFNLSGADSVTFYLFCPDSTYFSSVNSTNFSVPITCDYTSFKFQLMYGTTGYYRSFILTPDETDHVPIYLIDVLTTTPIYTALVADDLLKAYINPRVYVYKNIGNSTVQITANYVDITQKISAYLIENNQYTVVIKSDNLPDYVVGIYGADSSGTVSIKLYQTALYYNGDGDRKPYYYTAYIDNSTGDILVLATYVDTMHTTSDVMFSIYSGGTLLQTLATLDSNNAQFTYNLSPTLYNTTTIYGQFDIIRNSTGVESIKISLSEPSTQADIENIKDYVSKDTLNWILIIVLALLAIMGTMQTANYVAIALIFIAGIFLIFHLLAISASVLAIAGLVALVSLLKEGERNS